MAQVTIENPVINSLLEETRRHFRFTEDGVMDEIVDGHRISEYFVPIPRTKKKSSKQLSFKTEWTSDRLQENQFTNWVWERVKKRRKGCYQGITHVSAQLIEYWNKPGREPKLFFCQIEALETVIYVTEAAGKYGDTLREIAIQRANTEANPLLCRIASKWQPSRAKSW